MEWLENLKNLAVNGVVGECPHCHGINTDYCITILNKETKMGYGDMWCNDCMHGYHLSRLKQSDKLKYITADEPSPIPEKIKY